MENPERFRDMGTVREFVKNQTVFEQNEPGDTMFIVLEGLFGVYINAFTDTPVRVADIRPGSFFGEMSILDGWPRSATVVAEEDGAVLVVEKGNFGALLEKAPDLAAGILETLRGRAADTVKAVRDAGREAPSLPPLLFMMQLGDLKQGAIFFAMLAQQLRRMNDLLAAPDEPAVER